MMKVRVELVRRRGFQWSELLVGYVFDKNKLAGQTLETQTCI